MKDIRLPLVAVIGGLQVVEPAKRGAAEAAARQVGEELAKAGFGLVVYYSHKDSLEPYVVAGYATGADKGATGAIRVRYAESQRGQVSFPEQETRGELFEPPLLFPGPDWEAPFYRSLAEDQAVDAVLLLGGATSVFIAGQIAMARRLAILAVDEFGGSAARIWTQMAQATPDHNLPSWGTRPAKQLVVDLKRQVDAADRMRKESQRREKLTATLTAQSTKIALASVTFVLLLCAMYFGLVSPPPPSLYTIVMLAGLVTAGATRALARVAFFEPEGSDARSSLFFGALAGFVVGLAYLIPQWVGAPGVLAPTAGTVSATDKIQLASATLVAVSAGIGFDTVFNRLQRQAQDAAIGPPN